MEKHLYFIAEICKTLKAGSSEEEVNLLLNKIVKQGKKPKYRQGLMQFIEFVSAGEAGWYSMSKQHQEYILQLVNDISDSSPKDTSQSPYSLSLLLESNDVVLASYNVSKDDRPFIIGDLLPGNYTLKTDSDWLLWQATLTESNLLWTHAHPDQDLLMAAETDDVGEVDHREIILLDGELILRVYPGLETGSMSIMVKGYAEK